MLNPIPNANFKHLQSMKYARVFSIKRCNLYNMVAVSFKYNQSEITKIVLYAHFIFRNFG